MIFFCVCRISQQHGSSPGSFSSLFSVDVLSNSRTCLKMRKPFPAKDQIEDFMNANSNEVE